MNIVERPEGLKAYKGMMIAAATINERGEHVIAVHAPGVGRRTAWRWITLPAGPVTERTSDPPPRTPTRRDPLDRDWLQHQADIGDSMYEQERESPERHEGTWQ